VSVERFDPAHIGTRFNMLLALLDKGEDMTGTTYNISKEDDLATSNSKRSAELDAALTRKATAEAKIAEAKATEATLQLKNIKASNDYHRELFITGPIMETDDISNTLKRWARRDPGKPITIYLNTPGGSVFDGNALGATIDELRRAGHRVTIVGLGTVLSMGAILLQYADERVLAKDAVFMIHSLSGRASGQLEDVVDTTAMWKEVNDRLLTKLTERANITKAQLKKKVSR